MAGNIGDSVVLKCLVRGVPMPEVKWTVDGDSIETDGSVNFFQFYSVIKGSSRMRYPAVKWVTEIKWRA